MDIESFKAQVSSFARPALFYVNISGSAIAGIDTSLLQFTCHASEFPSSSISSIDVPYMGRKAATKIPGIDRTWSDWSTKINLNSQLSVYKQLLNWHGQMNDPVLNTAVTSNISLMRADAYVTMLDMQQIPVMTMKLVGLWPNEIPAISLDWSQGDAIAEIDVKWKFDYAVPADTFFNIPNALLGVATGAVLASL